MKYIFRKVHEIEQTKSVSQKEQCFLMPYLKNKSRNQINNVVISRQKNRRVNALIDVKIK